MSLMESLDNTPNILQSTLFIVNWNECLELELVGHASVPKYNTDKHFVFISSNSTSSFIHLL